MFDNFEELRENCLNCRRCGLCETRTNVVVGVGNPRSKVMFIGEGPGEEQEACIGWLRNQVALIRPKIIVCLGRIAAMRIIKPDMKITREHGQFFEKNGTLMMATLHPAALLRNPNQKPAAFEDFLKLREKIDELRLDVAKTYDNAPE